MSHYIYHYYPENFNCTFDIILDYDQNNGCEGIVGFESIPSSRLARLARPARLTRSKPDLLHPTRNISNVLVIPGLKQIAYSAGELDVVPPPSET